MAGPFGRSRRSRGNRTKFQSGCSCTSNNKGKRVGRSKAGSVENQKPTRKKCTASLKAGRGKAQQQQQGSESGSSQESSSATASPTSIPGPKFKACRRGRRRRRRRTRFYSSIAQTPTSSLSPTPRPNLSYPTPISPTIPTTPIVHKFRHGPAKPTATAKKTILSPSTASPSSSSSSSSTCSFVLGVNITIFISHRICEKDGRNTSSPSTSNNIVKTGDEGRGRRRNRGGPRGPHCPLHWA